MSKPMERRLDQVVDVMRVPATGDPLVAVRSVGDTAAAAAIECEVLIVGGGTGGVAAALAAARRGRRVCLVEETDWIGGQLSAQGVCALDEHEHIEAFGGTRSYYALRRAIRDHYRALAPAGRPADFNPGACWVTRLAFEPKAAVAAMEAMLQPFVDGGALRILRRMKAVAARTEGDRIDGVTVMGLDDGAMIRVRPAIVIDATELGELLPLTGTDYLIGAETVAATGEPHAQPVEPKPHCVQSFTYTFAAERMDRGAHVIPRPDKYEHYRAAQPFSLTIEVHGGEIYGEDSGWLTYRLFETMPGTKGGLWTYRRLIDRTLFPGVFANDVTMFNWPGNDYRDRSILDLPAAEMAAALQDAKRVSLGFLHWLQTEAPAEGERLGAPEIRLRPDVMGSADGLSKFPYIREARRIRALKTVVEHEVSAASQPGPRAAHFADSVGIGWYPIDIHRSGPDDVGASCRTRPFQIPLGALLPARPVNLIAAAKNIGTTHVTNGCYRLHPVEWNLGEAAGLAAAWALSEGVPLRAIRDEPGRLRAFQSGLVDDGIPLAWMIDVGVDHPAFAAVQRLHMDGRPLAPDDLRFRPDEPVSVEAWRSWGGTGDPPSSRAEAALRLAGSLVS